MTLLEGILFSLLQCVGWFDLKTYLG